MADTAFPAETLELLAKNEVDVAKLYSTFAEVLPKQAPFWNRLSKEEVRHARLIRSLAQRKDPGLTIDHDRFDRRLFQISNDYLQEQITRAQGGSLSFKDALSVALDVETGLLEQNWFEVFRGGSSQFKEGMEALAQETLEHSDLIRQQAARKRWTLF